MPTLTKKLHKQTAYARIGRNLARKPKSWLITGVAGFIGSNLLEALLKLNQRVVGLDNFATGYRRNLEEVRNSVSSAQWRRFTLLEGDICDPGACARACKGVDYVLHQAALGSVPRSIKNPIDSNNSNVTGFINILIAARDQKVKRVVYASSSSVYGDHPELPKIEERIGQPLSPYAVTKCVNELYAGVFARCYGLESIGLRYFNVFGARQDPQGAYAAVIPKWIASILRGDTVRINGDGETSRDFCYVANVVQANILSATVQQSKAVNQCYNIAVGDRTSLNELFHLLETMLQDRSPGLSRVAKEHGDFRPGDVRHSHASIRKARRLLAYQPTHRIVKGLGEALDWYVSHFGPPDIGSGSFLPGSYQRNGRASRREIASSASLANH